MDGDNPNNPADGSNPQGNPENAPKGPGGPESGVDRQEVRHAPVSARVPERIGRGVLSNGIAVLDSPTEFVIDFFQGLSRPPLIVARVVMAPRNMVSFLAALRDNFDRYTKTFGPP